MSPAPATPGRILVVGSGGREHVLAWRLARDAGVTEVIVAPGNAGMRDVATVIPGLVATDAAAVVALARAQQVELVVVGPEAPLVAGVADALRVEGIPVFGPDAAAAAIEGSKAFCREVAEAAGVPMAEGRAFADASAALAFAARLGTPVVIKADGLAAGKGVTVCQSLGEAEEAIRDALERRVFGAAGERVVVEKALRGPEASLIAMCDATTALALPPARDYKRIGEGDRGPNTGGMGAFSPLPDVPDAEVAALVERIHRPVLAELARRGAPFRGALFAGLMLTEDGPRLLEFNVRFGDPEAQALLPRLALPLAPLLLAAARDRLAAVAAALGIGGPLLPAEPGATVAVVLAAPGYPGRAEIGATIRGLDALGRGAPEALVFHAGVAHGPDGGLLTAGGRVLTVVGRGPDLAAAAREAHDAADLIGFPGLQRRRDVGRVLAPTAGGLR